MTKTNKRQDGLLEIVLYFMSFKPILTIKKKKKHHKVLHAHSLEITQ